MGEAANAIVDFGDRAIPLLVTLFRNTDSWLVRQRIVPLLIDPIPTLHPHDGLQVKFQQLAA